MILKKPDIRKATCLVIERDGEFFSRIEMLTGRIVWDRHLSSAWTTRNIEKARRKATAYGGAPMLFNKVLWRTKSL